MSSTNTASSTALTNRITGVTESLVLGWVEAWEGLLLEWVAVGYDTLFLLVSPLQRS